METVLPILAMLALVACSGIALRFAPRLPLPLLQITVGALLAWADPRLVVHIDPQAFLLLFLPPMLFADGWQMPKREFGLHIGPILALSVGLVLATVLVVGYALHAMLPAMPLPVAFLLAAVLSPTDVLAVSAIARSHALPLRLRHVLEGESLMNDASALVAVKFAVAATLTHHFSASEAALEVLRIGGIGLATGALFSWVLCRLHDRLLYWHEDQPVVPTVLLLLLMPFAPYLIAEELGGSGVLAAVAAGMTASLFDVKSSRFNACHVQTRATWNVVGFAFNGLVFMLLGQQLPGLLAQLPLPVEGGGVTTWRVLQLGAGALSITVLLLALRFDWPTAARSRRATCWCSWPSR